MLRTKIGAEYIKRSLRQAYGFTQSTPVHSYLDDAWDRSVGIVPGMAMEIVAGTPAGGAGAAYGSPVVSLVSGDNQVFGLSAFYINATVSTTPSVIIDEVADQGINAMAVWVLGGPDSQFEVDTPAFLASGTGSITTATAPGALIYAINSGANRGKLALSNATNAGTKPLARLIRVQSSSTILIGGLGGTV